MVEGPGCTRNGRKMQSVVGKVVMCPDNSEGMVPPLPNDVTQTLVGHTLESAFTIGKELFLIFKTSLDDIETELALRLHFGMNGSLNLRQVDSKSQGSMVAPWKQNKTVSLRLYFSNNTSRWTILEAWDTNVSTRITAEVARTKLCHLSSKDACSTMFQAQEVFTSLRRDGHNLSISDALLHQELFPGVGNIIKVESLHRSQIDPRRKVKDLSDHELRRIVRYARKFSMDWLNTGRAGTKLVYNQTDCGTCRGRTVKMQKIGGGEEDSTTTGKTNGLISRVTFWCIVCQPASLNKEESASDKKENSSSQLFVPSLTSRTVQCPEHGTKSIKLCRVRNSTKQNNLRIFFTCKWRGCKFFSWADNQFCQCNCGSKAVLRVSKTETSGGRWFFCCAKRDKKSGTYGCGHFEWARDEQLSTLGSYLTPLL